MISEVRLEGKTAKVYNDDGFVIAVITADKVVRELDDMGATCWMICLNGSLVATIWEG